MDWSLACICTSVHACTYYVTATLLTQDAHECWSAIVSALADRLPIRYGDPSQVSVIHCYQGDGGLLLATTCHTKTKFHGPVFWSSLKDNVSFVIIMYCYLIYLIFG